MPNNPPNIPENSLENKKINKFKQIIKEKISKLDVANPLFEKSNILLKSEMYVLEGKEIQRIMELLKFRKISDPVYIKKYNILIDSRILFHTEMLKCFDALGIIDLKLTNQEKAVHWESDRYNKK